MGQSNESQVMQEKNQFDTLYTPFYRTEQLIVTSTDPSNDAHYVCSDYFSITSTYYLEMTSLTAQITLTVTASRKLFHIPDLCVRPLPKCGDCLIESATEYFNRTDVCR